MKSRVILTIWIMALACLSLSPLPFKLRLHTHGPLHDWIHYLAFMVTAVILWLAAPGPFTRAAGFSLGCVFAFLQEWAENRIYHAGFEYKDVASDTAGLVTGFALMLLITTLAGHGQHSRSRHDY